MRRLPMISWPRTIGTRGPVRADSLTLAMFTTAISPHIGTNIAPALTADSPRICWKYRPNRKMTP